MPKIFSESEKLSHKQLLFDRGLALIMERGYKNVTVDELIKLTGGSKGYFYLLFESKEDFFLKARSNAFRVERAPSPIVPKAQICQL